MKTNLEPNNICNVIFMTLVITFHFSITLIIDTIFPEISE